MPKDMTETVAKAICKTDCGAPCRRCTRYIAHARAAISAHESALAADGYVIVPREPTEAMQEAHRRAYRDMGVIAVNQWKAAISAALKEKP